MRSSRLLTVLAVIAIAAGCSSEKKNNPAAPPPDNPDPPVLQYTADLQSSGQAFNLVAPNEALAIEVVTVIFNRPGAGGMTVETDFTPGTIAQGTVRTIHVTTAWTWQDSDEFTLGVRVRRPGQQTTFGLCCANCSHTGATLHLGPCTQ